MENSRNQKIVAIVQARMSSARLPGKVLRPANGRPMLAYLLDRLSRLQAALPVVVATSRGADDDAIAAFCGHYGVGCVRGPLDDVAARFIQALDETGADAFVRVNGDSPLLDQALIDRAVSLHADTNADLVTNVQRRTFPKGMSVEVVRGTALRRAAANLNDAEDREHVTRAFYRAPGNWKIAAFESGRDLGGINLSVDSADDFEVFEKILACMSKPHWQYGLDEILVLSAAPAHAPL